MLKKIPASKSFFKIFSLQRKAILFFVDTLIAKICNSANIRLNRNFKIKCRKLILAGLIFFFTAFSIGFFISIFNNEQQKSFSFFSDLPVDHQIYHDVSKLLELDGCIYRSNNCFAPYEPMTAREFNHALTTIIRFYQLTFSEDLLLDSENVCAAGIGKKIRNLALIVGREERLKRISRQRLENITRMNLYGILEQIFFKDKYEDPFI